MKTKESTEPDARMLVRERIAACREELLTIAAVLDGYASIESPAWGHAGDLGLVLDRLRDAACGGVVKS